jgi:hypothetical protein
MNSIFHGIHVLLNKTIFPFFLRRGRLQPIKFFITIFLSLIVWATIEKIQYPNKLGTDFILGLWGFISILMGIDTWRQNGKDKYKHEDTTNKL